MPDHPLSPAAKHTLAHVGLPLQYGMTRAEIASALGITRHELRRRIEQLGRELKAGERHCERCGEPLPAGSRGQRRYCSGRCRVAAHRAA